MSKQTTKKPTMQQRVTQLEKSLEKIIQVYDFTLTGMNVWVSEQDEKVKELGGIQQWWKNKIEEHAKEKESQRENDLLLENQKLREELEKLQKNTSS